MKKSFALLALVSLMALAGCNKTGNSGSTPASNKPTPSVGGGSLTPPPSTSTNTPSVEVVKTALQTPVVTVSTQVSGQVTWEDVEHAAYYLVYVNDDTDGIEVVGTSYKIPLLDTGLSAKVRVRAIAETDDETYKDSELSAEVTATHFASTSDSWDKEALRSEWTASDGVLETINEGLDLKKGQSMAIAKKISKDKPHLVIKMRDFEGQEGNNETGAKVKVTVDGVAVESINYKSEEITLDKNCGREMLVIYRLDNLNIDYEKDHVIRISEMTNYSNHCVIINAELKDMSDVMSVATEKNYWGHNYSDNWGSEMTPREGVSVPTTIGDDSSWIKAGDCESINEGFKLQKEASITKLVHVTEDTAIMTIAVRNFGGADEDYAGGVSINGVAQVAVGDTLPFFTKKTSATYFEGANDGGQVGTMKTYDLSSYIGEDVWVAIGNLKCYAPGGNEDLVIGSISFGKENKITETKTTEMSNINGFADTGSLMLAGPGTMFNEGVSFRTNDFAGGIAEKLDLSEVEAGKHVYVKTYWRSLVDDNVTGKFQVMVDGALTDTHEFLTRDRGDNFAVVGIDLTDKVGSKVNYAIHIPSRNFRMVLSKIEYVVTDTVEENISHPATEDVPILDYSNGEFAWGHNYRDNWGGEMGDDALKYDKILDSWTGEGDTNDGFNEGLKIGRGSSISKTMTIDDKHVTMAFTARTFGSDFKGEVTVKDGDATAVALTAIGYTDPFFTKNGAYTKLDSTSDDCQNAPMYVYDLSTYLNKEVTITIKNLSVDSSDGFADELVVGSIGFTSICKVTESKTWDGSVIKQLNDKTALEVLPVGPFSIYNEGINFRTQDFAGGFTRTFDLSDEILTGKTVKIRVGMRNFNGGEDVDFQMLLNGALVSTQKMNVNETIQYLEFDVTPLIGNASVNLGIHIPTRTYRVVLANLQIVVE